MAKYNYKTGLQEIGDGVFAYIREGIGWDICNSGLIVGEDECLVVDAMMVGSMVRSFMEDVRRVTDKPGPLRGRHPSSCRPRLRQPVLPARR